MRRAQYDDIYTEWEENGVFIRFLDIEEEESYARELNRIHYR